MSVEKLFADPIKKIRTTNKKEFEVLFCCSCVSAERVSSLGKDWHRGCLKCTKCKKTLTPGGHAEVKAMLFRYVFFSHSLASQTFLPRVSKD